MGKVGGYSPMIRFLGPRIRLERLSKVNHESLRAKQSDIVYMKVGRLPMAADEIECINVLAQIYAI